MANIMIDIAAEFVGKPAFKQAETSTDKLTKNVKKLAGALGLAFGTQQILAFGKASVKAFLEDETAITRLTKAVENLGLGFEDARITRFIAELEKSAAVSDDVLRPAFQKIISTTGSVVESQKLLALALDISAGTGIDAATVAQDLSLAYLGQTKGLAKYNTGLTKTELTSVGFLKIQQKLTDQYSGQNAARLDTYAGKVAAVNVAYGNLQETVGEALVNAFMKLAGDTTTEDLTESIDNLAESLAAVVELTGAVAAPFVGLAKYFNDAAGAYTKFLYKVTGATYMGKVSDRQFGGIYADQYKASEEKANAAARARAEAEAKKRAAELLAMQKKNLKAQQDNLKLSKAKAIFDLQKIQIEAALKGKITEEERIRLKLMQAIEEENITQIEKYTKLLDEAQKKTIELRDALKVVNPFESWLTGINAVLAGMFSVGSQIQANGREWSSFANLTATTSIQSNLKEWSSSFSPSATTTAQASPVVNNVTVNAGVGDPEAIARVIEDTLRQSSYRGTGALVAL